ncbi:hypothetical protein M422DRAFT_36989 [Sphaerobolus stellatus SS14]|uniref:Uncharacterized protein n=1 Tax=Sphaerobolus stellatus (strain SS14) TaxID=990650 RepID=A0A0C9UVK1_SPHS4|nr:hypothetical protein M422DRAFT_36989 [Sphaerobolus stellatus SS14]
MVDSFVNGHFLHWDFRRIKKNEEQKCKEAGNKNVDDKALELDQERTDFPYEYAHLRTIPLLVGIFITVVVGYRWAIQVSINLAVPLILQFIHTLSLGRTWLFHSLNYSFFSWHDDEQYYEYCTGGV